MRDTIFIGHATPEDNDFTLWLYYKLRNEGYKVECDLTYLLGGESDYWDKLQGVLENSSCKYVLVLSEVTFNKEGVKDEWEHCKSIGRREGIQDFIIPVKVDGVRYDTRIGLNRINVIDFSESWALGLKRLIRKLEHDGVPGSHSAPLSLELWHRNKFSTFSGIIKKREKFYSNWVRIPILPKKIHFFRFHNRKQAAALARENNVFPVVHLDNHLISFSDRLNFFHEKKGFEILPRHTFSVSTDMALNRFEGDELRPGCGRRFRGELHDVAGLRLARGDHGDTAAE